MSIQKNISSAYTIYSVNRTDPIIFDSARVYINGNLTVTGNTSTITSTDTAIKDNKIILNDGEAGAGVSAGTAGVEIARGSLANVSIIWDESVDSWKITRDGSTFTNIVATSTGLTALIDDPDPTLGANLKVGSNWIVSTGDIRLDPANDVLINGPLRLQNQASFPSVSSGENYLVAGTPGTGGSGFYVINSSASQQELVTKSKAIVFSLIF